MTDARLPRESRTPITDAGGVLEELHISYTTVRPGDEDFITSTFGKMWRDETLNAEEMERELSEMVFSESGPPPKTVWYGVPSFILIACAHCVHAMKASNAGNDALAWSHVSDAQRWCGMAYGIVGNSDGIKPAHVKGGEAIKARSLIVGSYAFELANERDYQSKAEAIRHIKDRVMAYALEKHNWRISQLRAEKTIGELLKAQKYDPKASPRGT